MADIGGFAGGIQSAVETLSGLQQYQQQKQLFPIQLQDAQLTEQMKQVTLASSQMQLKSQQQEMMMLSQLAASGKLGPGQSPAEQLSAMAQVKIAGGDVNGAREMLSTASTITANQSLNAEREYKVQTETWGTIGSLLQNVHSPEDFAKVKIQFMREHPQAMSDPGVQNFMQAEYSPDTVQKAIDGAQTRLQQAQTKAADIRAQLEQASIPLRAAQIRAANAAADLHETQANNLKKAGGKNILPKESDYKFITDLVHQKHGDDLTDTQLQADIRSRATPVVERFLQLTRSGVPASAAQRQAFSEAETAGIFHDLPNRGSLGRPNSPDRPMALPQDPSKVQDGQWYLIDGKPRLAFTDTHEFLTQEEIDERLEKEEDEDGVGAE